LRYIINNIFFNYWGIFKMLRNFLKISFFAILLSPFVSSQELTSDMSGTVVSAEGAVSGATVEITYEPTNSKVTRITDSSGKYFVGGLRPGGPYKVVVSAPGTCITK
jgi:hypothetical protein